MLKTMKTTGLLFALAAATLMQGCTTSLVEGQRQELAVYKEKGLEVKEKNTALAAGLGIFPMAGYFYTGHYVLAITTLPLYPFLGPLWMPFDTHSAAESRNYYATKLQVERDRAKAMREADKLMEDGVLDYPKHVRKIREIENKYSAM